jgi:hypothetical protein
MFPNAEFLDSYDAGRGQRYFLFGADAPFEAVLTYYRQTLKTGGDDILPGMRQFELGDFRRDRMAYPPSVVVKDYSTTTPSGFLFARGSAEKRYRTVIQVVPPQPPPPPAARR